MKKSPVMSCRLFWYKVTSNMVEQPTTYHHRYLFPYNGGSRYLKRIAFLQGNTQHYTRADTNV